MPDPQKKLVQVNGLGVIEFPGGMQDDQIAATIKRHKAQTHSSSPHFTGKSTEESEKARQLKPAQPLSTAIPHLPEWANTPLVSGPDDPSVEAIAPDPKRESEANARILRATQPTKAWLGKHPKTSSALSVGMGVGQGVADTAQGLTTPANIALIAGAPESKLLSAFFAVQALTGAYRSADAAMDAYVKGNNPDAARYATQAALGLGVAGLAGAHAIKDVPSPVTENPVGRVTSGDIGNSRAYAVHDPTGTLIGKLKVSSPGLGREGVDASVKELGKLGIHSQDMVEVGGSNIRAGFQGKGYGKQMYEEMIKSETAKGKTVVSDLSGATTPDAARVWEGLVRRGLAKKVGNIYYSSPRETGGQK